MRAAGTGLDADTCRRAVARRDARFDGWFVAGTATNGGYCRPSCDTLGREPVIFRSAASAQAAGLLACRHCRPDGAPGSPEWDLRTDLAARAVRLITDGAVEREGVAGLAGRLGCSAERLTAVLGAELGAGPLELAAARRAQVAWLLLVGTDLPASEVACAAGFGGRRQLDGALLAVYGMAAEALRAAGPRPPGSPAGLGGTGLGGSGAGTQVTGERVTTIALRLPTRAPVDAAGLLSFLVRRAVPGVEHGCAGRYARTLALPHGPATVALGVDGRGVDAVFRLSDLRDLGPALARIRRLTDADTDPAGADEVLAADPALAPSVLATPGIRVPGAVDGPELVLRALLGQQVSVAAARTTTARLAAALGAELPPSLRAAAQPLPPSLRAAAQPPPADGDLPARDAPPGGELRRLFPTPDRVAEDGAGVLTGPRRRIAAIRGVAAALAAGDLRVHAGRDPVELSNDLQALPGIGPWTAGYVAMRVLGATDVLLSTDLMVRRGAEALGLPATVPGLEEHSRRWRPWRSYAAMHLWRNSG